MQENTPENINIITPGRSLQRPLPTTSSFRAETSVRQKKFEHHTDQGPQFKREALQPVGAQRTEFRCGWAAQCQPKIVQARGPQNRNAEVFDQTRCLRTFECRTRHGCQRSSQDMLEKRVLKQIKALESAIVGGGSLVKLLVAPLQPPEFGNQRITIAIFCTIFF